MPFHSRYRVTNPNLFLLSRQKRQEQTKSEKLLWRNLRNRKLRGYKFRRQHPYHKYILDFYCHECKLAIEVDGEYHNAEDQIQRDSFRSLMLSEFGITVIRFSNEQIILHLDDVLKEIEKHLFENSFKP